jgi:sugar O-acyltransferase (sialic acid O-acetyltransferase NeuD family)
MKPLAVIGAGGHALEIIALIEDINRFSPSWRLDGLLVDQAFRPEHREIDGYPILGGLEWLADKPEVWVAIAIGASASRREITDRLGTGFTHRYATLIHPRAWLASTAQIGPGCQILAGALVNAHAQLGNHAILNLGSSVSHECRLGDFATLGPGARLAGNVVVGVGAEIGMGACVLPKIRIGDGAVVGAGAVVTRAVADHTTVCGVPARLHGRT